MIRQCTKAMPLPSRGGPCYVLADETRVLSQRGLIHGLGMVKGSTRSGDDQLTVLANGLLEKSLINNDLAAVSKNPIRFKAPHGGRPAFGYPATVLADLCEAVLAARVAPPFCPPNLPNASAAAFFTGGGSSLGASPVNWSRMCFAVWLASRCGLLERVGMALV